MSDKRGKHGKQRPKRNQDDWHKGRFLESGKPPLINEYEENGITIKVYGVGWAKGLAPLKLWSELL